LIRKSRTASKTFFFPVFVRNALDFLPAPHTRAKKKNGSSLGENREREK
jgi:hypothetical protein